MNELPTAIEMSYIPIYEVSDEKKTTNLNSHLDTESVRVAKPGLVSESVTPLEWLTWTSRPGAVDPI